MIDFNPVDIIKIIQQWQSSYDLIPRVTATLSHLPDIRLIDYHSTELEPNRAKAQLTLTHSNSSIYSSPNWWGDVHVQLRTARAARALHWKSLLCSCRGRVYATGFTQCKSC